MRDSDTLRVSVARFPTLLSVTEEFAEDQPKFAVPGRRSRLCKQKVVETAIEDAQRCPVHLRPACSMLCGEFKYMVHKHAPGSDRYGLLANLRDGFGF